MSAPEVTLLLPELKDLDLVLSQIVDILKLKVYDVPEGFSFDFLADLRDDEGAITIEYSYDASMMVEELFEWEKPTEEYKNLIAECKSELTIRYRGLERAKLAVRIAAETIGGILLYA